jgi:CRISPR/Cas system-associated endonuclease Cas3-HD
MMIDKAPGASQCTEVLVTHVSNVTTLFVTEVYVSAASQMGHLIEVETVQLGPQNSAKICAMNESVILSEWHSKMNIVYQYTFLNTTRKKLHWWSRFDSDIHFLISRKILQSNEECQDTVKLIHVTYQKRLQYHNHLKKPVTQVNYQPAK